MPEPEEVNNPFSNVENALNDMRASPCSPSGWNAVQMALHEMALAGIYPDYEAMANFLVVALKAATQPTPPEAYSWHEFYQENA